MGKKSQPVDPWQAECDARTLKEYAMITSDKSRMSKAASVLRKEQAAINKAMPTTGGKKK